MAHRDKDPNLTRIILVLIAVVVLLLGGYRAVRWYNEDYVGRAIEDSAPADLEKARGLADAGNIPEAMALLTPIVSRVKDNVLAPKALMLLSELHLQNGQREQAVASLRRAIDEFPGSPERPRASIALARLFEKTGQIDDARALYEAVRDSAPPGPRAPALVGLGRLAELDGKRIEARDLYRQAAQEADWNGETWDEAVDPLGRVNVELVFAATSTPDSKIHTVESGDTLTNIGVKLNVTQGMLLRANELTEDATLRIGQRLKYTPKDFRIVIERSTCRLFLFDKDGLFKCYRTGLGKEGHETSLGAFKIGNKQKNPAWFKPGVGEIPPGDPQNELGTRWMPLVPLEEGLPRDLGIHGTDKPETVGTYSSSGCARLTREDVEELYDLTVRSTPVEIVHRYQQEQDDS